MSSAQAAVPGGMESSLEENGKPPEVKFSLDIQASGHCSSALVLRLLPGATRCPARLGRELCPQV